MGGPATPGSGDAIATWARARRKADDSVLGSFPGAAKLAGSVVVVCAAAIAAGTTHPGMVTMALVCGVALSFVALMVSTRRIVDEATLAGLSHDASAREVDAIRRRMREIESHLSPDSRPACSAAASSLPLPAPSIPRQAMGAPDSLLVLSALTLLASAGSAVVALDLASSLSVLLPGTTALMGVAGVLCAVSAVLFVVARVVLAAMKDTASRARREILDARSFAAAGEEAAGIVDNRPPFSAFGGSGVVPIRMSLRPSHPIRRSTYGARTLDTMGPAPTLQHE